MIIRRLLGVLRLTTSGFSSQSHRQASLSPGLLLIRNDSVDMIEKYGRSIALFCINYF
jgi:hypothetical protein